MLSKFVNILSAKQHSLSIGTFNKKHIPIFANLSNGFFVFRSREGIFEQTDVFTRRSSRKVDYNDKYFRKIEAAYRFHIPVWQFNVVFSHVGVYAMHASLDPKTVSLRPSVPGVKFSLHGATNILLFAYWYFYSLIQRDAFVKLCFFRLESNIHEHLDVFLNTKIRHHYSEKETLSDFLIIEQAKLLNDARFLFDVRRLISMILDNRIHVPCSKMLSHTKISEEFTWIHEKYPLGPNRRSIAEISKTLLALELLMDDHKVVSFPGLSTIPNSKTLCGSYFKNKQEFLKYSNFQNCADFQTRTLRRSKTLQYDVELHFQGESWLEKISVASPGTQVNFGEHFVVADHFATVITSNNLITDSCQEDLSVVMYRGNHPLIHRTFQDGALCDFEHDLQIIEGGALCSTGSISNFYTWMIEVLPRLCEANEAKLRGPYYTIGHKTKWHQETLDLLGLSGKIVFLSPTCCYRFKNTNIVNTSTKEISNLSSLKKVSQGFKRHVAIDDTLPEKIYVSRRKYFANRYLINEFEIEKYFLQQGFEIIYPERHSVLDQVKIFNSAKIIAGPTGAWASNLMHCNSSSKVYMITPIDHLGKFFPHIHSTTGGRFSWVATNPIKTKLDERVHADHYLPMPSLQAIDF